MKLTPLEVKQKRFQSSFRGIDQQEVEEFLQLVSEEMEELVRDNNELKGRVSELEERLLEHRDREQTLKQTLLTAQKMSEDLKAIAEREAQALISKAEVEAERFMQDAELRRRDLISDIHDLKRQKIQFETTLRSSIEVHLKMLDALNEQERRSAQSIEQHEEDSFDSYEREDEEESGDAFSEEN